MKWFTLTAALMVCCASTSSADAGLLDLFDASSYLRFDGHFSTKGHRRVGEHVAHCSRNDMPRPW
mgnify:CR=1 FL=1